MAFALVGLITAATVLPMGMTAPRVERPRNYLTAPVTRGSLQITLSQRGLIDSAENITVASECEWTTRIIDLVPEGSVVEEGQMVVQLDTSELVERLRQREVLLIDAKAELIEAEEVLKMQKIENESGLAKAALNLELAQLDLNKFIEGDQPKEQKEAEAAVALAQEDVSRAKERYEYMMRMARKGYENPMSVEKERLQLLRLENKLDTARRALSVLLDHTHPRMLKQLEAGVTEAQRAMERANKIAKVAILNRQVRLHTRQTKYDATLEYVERLRKSIAACTIKAPKSGEIIYANEGSVRDEVIEGEYIRRGQDVVRIPDLSTMDVDIRIHESLINGVRKGLPVNIRVDAYPDQILTGYVAEVGRVPTTGQNYNFDLREYEATIRINPDQLNMDKLKPGLTAQVTILVDRVEDCLKVPMQSIVPIGDQTYVFVETARGPEHKEVELGKANDTDVIIVSGLSGTDEVLLSPRTNCTDQLLAIEQQQMSETNAENIGG